MSEMSEKPDVIYLQPACCDDNTYGRQWCSDPSVWDHESYGHTDQPVAYVRMDLAIKRGYNPMESQMDDEKMITITKQRYFTLRMAERDLIRLSTELQAAWKCYGQTSKFGGPYPDEDDDDY